MKTKMNFHVIGLGDEPLDTTPSATSKKKKNENYAYWSMTYLALGSR